MSSAEYMTYGIRFISKGSVFIKTNTHMQLKGNGGGGGGCCHDLIMWTTCSSIGLIGKLQMYNIIIIYNK